MDEGKKWDAVVRCDADYDGKFYYGVKTTKIFCRPSCNSKTPLRNNVAFFADQKEALENGFRPCKRCRPDLLEYEPVQELAERAKFIYDKNFTEDLSMKEGIQELHVTNNHLVNIFLRQYGMTPREYILRKRIELAKELLVNTQYSIITIAAACGYESLSTFYDNFNRLVNISPGQYRRDAADQELNIKEEGYEI